MFFPGHFIFPTGKELTNLGDIIQYSQSREPNKNTYKSFSLTNLNTDQADLLPRIQSPNVPTSCGTES